MQLRQNCVDNRVGNLTIPLNSFLLLLSLSERLGNHLPLAFDCLVHHLLRGQMPEPYLFLLLSKMLVDILLCVLEHRLTMECLLSFPLYSLRLPLFLITGCRRGRSPQCYERPEWHECELYPVRNLENLAFLEEEVNSSSGLH